MSYINAATESENFVKIAKVAKAMLIWGRPDLGALHALESVTLTAAKRLMAEAKVRKHG